MNRMRKYAAASLVLLLTLSFLTGCADEPATGPTTATTASSTTGTTGSTTTETTEPTEVTTAMTTAQTTTATAKPTTVKTTAKPTTAPTAAYSKNEVEYYGRFSPYKDSYRFDWALSAVEGGFEGTAVTVDLTCYAANSTNNVPAEYDYFNAYVDGAFVKTFKVNIGDGTYPLAEGLPKGYHSVRIEKISEADWGAVCVFDGFTFPGGKAAKAPARKTRLIEVVGDSLTAGYGNLASYVQSCTNWTQLMENEDASQTYGKFAADCFGAECVNLGISGAGLTRDIVGRRSPVFYNDMYFRTVFRVEQRKDWTGEGYQPDVIVIDLGANDYQTAAAALPAHFDETYVADYLTFTGKLRKMYPKTHIVCALGPDMTALEQVKTVVERMQAAGDKNVSFLAMEVPKDFENWGADGHPSVAGHVIMAEQLIAHLEKVMGW